DGGAPAWSSPSDGPSSADDRRPRPRSPSARTRGSSSSSAADRGQALQSLQSQPSSDAPRPDGFVEIVGPDPMARLGHGGPAPGAVAGLRAGGAGGGAPRAPGSPG